MKTLFIVAGVLLVGCASVAPPRVDVVHPIRVSPTNFFIIDVEEPILVDTSVVGTEADIVAGLEAHGFALERLDFILLTHGHHDHAGAAAALQAMGARVVAHQDEVPMLERGRNPEEDGVFGFEAALVSAVVNPFFPPLTPDGVIATERATFAKGRVVIEHARGHSPGSVTVVVDERVALVGDLLRGGLCGGEVAPRWPLLHYFHDDKYVAHRALRMLLAAHPKVTTIWPAHGGPFTRAQVEAFLVEQR